MRIHGDPERAKTNLRRGRETRRLAIAAARGAPVRPPAPGTALKRLRIDDCLTGESYCLEILQGRRRNSIVVLRDGKRIRLRHGSGLDALFRQIRHDWKLCWLLVN